MTLWLSTGREKRKPHPASLIGGHGLLPTQQGRRRERMTAPGRTAPCASLTVMMSAPVRSCAVALPDSVPHSAPTIVRPPSTRRITDPLSPSFPHSSTEKRTGAAGMITAAAHARGALWRCGS